MNRATIPAFGFVVLCSVAVSTAPAAQPAATFDPDPWHQRVEKLNAAIAANPETIDLYSQRGDALLFLGRFAEAAADYDRMVELDAARDASHWRRGIALFYAGQYDKAARQFERYHSFDNVDRENGIWRYLCQVKADGLEKARAGLLKYEKDDREPFGDVYKLFAGTIEPEAIVKRIDQADISDTEREKRKFYANLYIGLWHAAHDRPDQAEPFLKAAAANTWPANAGYGPHYMWHVGRVHYDLLTNAAK
jgi:lipoprotein NlpI